MKGGGGLWRAGFIQCNIIYSNLLCMEIEHHNYHFHTCDSYVFFFKSEIHFFLLLFSYSFNCGGWDRVVAVKGVYGVYIICICPLSFYSLIIVHFWSVLLSRRLRVFMEFIPFVFVPYPSIV